MLLYVATVALARTIFFMFLIIWLYLWMLSSFIKGAVGSH